MKLEARSRLAASAQLTTGPVVVKASDGKVWDFGSAQDYLHWLSHTSEPGYHVMTAIRVGHYEVIIFPKKTAVAKVYKDRHFDSPESHKAGHWDFGRYAFDRDLRIRQALTALQASHHPQMGEVKVDADAEIKFLEAEKKKLLGSRSQDWYHRLSPEQQAAYKAKYPGTKFHHKTELKAP